MSEAPNQAPMRPLKPGLLRALARVYADILRHQGRTTTQFVRWTRETGRRTHEFAWLGGELTKETLLSGAGRIKVAKSSPLFAAVQRMHAASTLNPYEREVLYGYPYVIGRRDGEMVRAPLLHVRVAIEPEGEGYVFEQADDVVQVNLLPFRTAGDPDEHEGRLARVLAETPALPLEPVALQRLAQTVLREFPYLTQGKALLDGTLGAVPEEPLDENGLRLIDQAALFVAPKSSYFLASDLDHIAAAEATVHLSGLGPLLGGGAGSQVDLSDEAVDEAQVFFPFPSNRAQRRAALLVEDETTRVIRVEGPPGTGKSLTIANIACHLAATGKTVLISSQKDKALEVVDEKLTGLQMEELPMTLLHNDRESKADLLRRLDRVRKERSHQEVQREFQRVASEFLALAGSKSDLASQYQDALALDASLEEAHRRLEENDGLLAGLTRRFGYWRAKRRALSKAALSSASVADAVSRRRERLLALAEEALELGGELTVARATREERAGLRELSSVLKRDQARFKNFSLFDRMKADAERAHMILKLLPVWIMSPDDVARLFPCQPGLFDVVIVDEGSQVDLPSIMPVAYRGKKLVVFGDSKQMQPRRFAFMSQDVTRQAWQRESLDRLDGERWFHPSEQSLLTLAYTRSEEEVLLNEHFRSLPPIIAFSNRRWYDGRLRIMTDERQKKYGDQRQPVFELHHVEDGVLSNGSQENEVEARALVSHLLTLVNDPMYEGASIGVICLFDEQVALVQEMVAERVPEQAWLDHEIVVINPDGFQGDERDVILYSLSYDAELMPQEALSARMSDQAHIQGMLNVAFTRARDEIHVFHSAPIEAFTFAGGRPGAITDWLRHAAEAQGSPAGPSLSTRPGEIESQFEADVAVALQEHGLIVQHQYVACGFAIGLVVEDQALDVRLAVECDGAFDAGASERPIERQDVLERAGWRIVRIPYRTWLRDPHAEVDRVVGALRELHTGVGSGDVEPADLREDGEVISEKGREWVSREQRALIEALREGGSGDEETVFLRARDLLESARLTQKLRRSLRLAASDLAYRGLIAIEEGEYFILETGRLARYATRRTSTSNRRR